MAESPDVLAIRELQQKWMQASMDGDVQTIRSLMTEDVVFLTSGRPPFGKREFIQSFESARNQVTLNCTGELEEVVVAGDIAYARALLDITVTPRNGNPPRNLSGYALTVFARSSDGNWQLSRDANLLTPKQA